VGLDVLEVLLQHRGLLILAATWLPLLAVAAAELFLEQRVARHPRWRRWASNLGVGFLDRAILRLLLPLGAVGAALFSAERELGLLHLHPLPAAAAAALTVPLLDLGGYLRHRLEHVVPLLWRFHRVHHADLDLDWSSAVRHHPVSVLFSGGFRLGWVLLIGASPLGLLLYFLLARPIDALAHGNVRIPGWLDRALRLVLVTPDVHVVHHSSAQSETDSNFGVACTAWDRLFRTFRAAADAGPRDLELGLRDFRAARDLDLDRLLLLPLRGRAAVRAGPEPAASPLQ
jgi:sterol desaturase/sphingolipid hydroxylase (fatty acid hydroxylase superfamily)